MFHHKQSVRILLGVGLFVWGRPPSAVQAERSSAAAMSTTPASLPSLGCADGPHRGRVWRLHSRQTTAEEQSPDETGRTKPGTDETGDETGGGRNRGQTERSPNFRRMEIGERPVCPWFFVPGSDSSLDQDAVWKHQQSVQTVSGRTILIILALLNNLDIHGYQNRVSPKRKVDDFHIISMRFEPTLQSRFSDALPKVRLETYYHVVEEKEVMAFGHDPHLAYLRG